jgi:hypothetical protein
MTITALHGLPRPFVSSLASLLFDFQMFACLTASKVIRSASTSEVASFLTATICHEIYSSAPVSTGNTFQDLPRLRETADNTERYIQSGPKKCLHTLT